MNANEDIDALCARLWEGLPDPLPPERIKALYGPAMEESRILIRKAFAPSAADVAVSLLREAGRTAMRIASRAADVAAELLEPPPVLQPAYAARALGAAPAAARPASSGALSVEKPGEGGLRLRLEIDAGANGRLDVRVRLLDASGARIAPFELSVADSESGEVLLKPTRYASGEAVLRGVRPGLYGLTAVAGDSVSTLSLRIGEEAGAR